MEINDKEEDETIRLMKKISDNLDPIEYASIFATMLGMGHLLCKYIIRNNSFELVPVDVKYAVLQQHQMMCLISSILNDRFNKEEYKQFYFSTSNKEWEELESIEKRFVLLVKLFYKQLKEEGKI